LAADPDHPLIVLTTDFGLSGAVGVMKGVILTINPRATIIDLTHQIPPQNIRQGAFILGNDHRFFPSNAIHVAVVDPGVGTSRDGLLVVTPRGRFVAPDNGLLTDVLWDASPETATQDSPAALPADCAAYTLTGASFWLDPVSRTFHGRDVFAPVAAHLSLGILPEQLGQSLSQIHRLASDRPSGILSGKTNDTLTGQVLHADNFGNLVTNITAGMLANAGDVAVSIKGRRILGLSRTFHDESIGNAGATQAPDGLIALISSNGYLEIAVTDGSAALSLQAGAGEPVQVTAS
jgi:S-adenosylmethionine hydrolase